MTQSEKIVKEINENGGIDMQFIRRNAMDEGITTFDYIKEYIKSNYCVHGLVAYHVACRFY